MAISVESYLIRHYAMFETFPQLIRRSIVRVVERIFHEKEINSFLQQHANKDAFSFIEAVLEYFELDIVINKNELQRIPSYGRVVIISNHPLGALDALALLHVIQDIRKDIKIVATDFLSSFENLSEVLIPVDNIQGSMSKTSVKMIYESLHQERAVIIFPSGEVSRAGVKGVKDTSWQHGFLKIAQREQAPILPIRIEAKNSKTFYVLSMLNRTLASLLLPHEMFTFQKKTIAFRIGKSIPYESYHLPSVSLKNRVKLLRKHFNTMTKKRGGVFKTYNEIALAESRQELKHELYSATTLGHTKDGKTILLYENSEESAVLREIGRLREISFRQVKEGSGKKRDIDEFDYYYEHIILWDEAALEIVGSYRVGKANDIIEALGVEGLYTATLFEYAPEFEHYFKEGIELGRSFVQPKYWNSRALDYLWQGIGAYLRANPKLRYMFGPVTISKSYNDEATALLVFFYRHYFPAKAALVAHKKQYEIPAALLETFHERFSLNHYKRDLVVLKNELQLMGFAVPTLFKQYADLCESDGVMFMDFGIDSSFNNCVDGFIVVDLNDLKPQKRQRYMGEE